MQQQRAQQCRRGKVRTGAAQILVHLIWLSGIFTLSLGALLSTHIFPSMNSVFCSRPSFPDLQKLHRKVSDHDERPLLKRRLGMQFAMLVTTIVPFNFVFNLATNGRDVAAVVVAAAIVLFFHAL